MGVPHVPSMPHMPDELRVKSGSCREVHGK